MANRSLIKHDRNRPDRPWSSPARSGAGRRRRRLSDPRVYLRAALAVAAFGAIALPYAADAVGLAAGSASVDGCRVARVIDGDTVTLWCPETGLERTRILGLDTPEKYSPGCARELAAAMQAEWTLRRVLFEADTLLVQRRGFDRYDRRLARIVLDGEDVAQIMISTGHARAYAGQQREGWCG